GPATRIGLWQDALNIGQALYQAVPETPSPRRLKRECQLPYKAAGSVGKSGPAVGTADVEGALGPPIIFLQRRRRDPRSVGGLVCERGGVASAVVRGGCRVMDGTHQFN